MTTIDDGRLAELLGRFVNDLGATVSAGNVLIGDELGLYRALAEAGPLTAAELAERTGTSERYVREWLPGQAAGHYITHDAAGGRYGLTPEQALAFADPDGLCLPGAFQLALSSMAAEPKIVEAFRTGRGVAWGEHHPGVFTGCERFFSPGYTANLLSSWIPAVDGLPARLSDGIAVADVGCGLGASTRILAGAFPASSVRGFDPHVESVELARKAAAEAGLDGRCDFAAARAQDFPGTGYGLVATFDCLHDMGDPLAAARHIRSALSDDGVWLIVEPFAGDSPADNLTPVGRVYYSFSTFLCVPHAASEGADDALGNQAGEAGIRPVVQAAGFRTFHRIAETPFNLVYEARP
ncbi:class I SAM-dependent methyltransferase [Actinomadura sp. 7K507]|uniref:class I SAM-dependent methyltransferase n=1 Tax=Actinomadura sp. 7K507 TaxID=2530365 RepID=UPI00104AAFC6|nr:class I SAM-dependent methyltransferase [Actinomadura sp. 7K507]TDC85564.1 methyltransferase domain-containing protein [Actinomadura sp. 7K507]